MIHAPWRNGNMKICKCDKLPSGKMFTETQYSTVRKKPWINSIPFMNLPSGEHVIKFIDSKGESINYLVKTWISMYGYAWQIISQKGQNYENE